MPLVLTEAEGRPAVNSSYFSSINPVDGQCLQEKYSDRFSDCNFGLLGNLYACEGKPGKVIIFDRKMDGDRVPAKMHCHYLLWGLANDELLQLYMNPNTYYLP